MKYTVNLSSGPIHLESKDSIRTAFRAGWVREFNVLHPDDGSEALTVKEYLERSGDQALLVEQERSKAAAWHDTPRQACPKSNPIALIAAGAMLLGFFLPWAQLFGFAASGYNLGRLGSYGNWAWVAPIGAALVLCANLATTGTRAIQVIAGLAPWIGLLYGLSEVGDKLFQVLSIGAYITLLSSAVLIFVPSHNEVA